MLFSGVDDLYSIQHDMGKVKLKLFQFGNVPMLDYDDVVYFVFMLDWKIQVY